MCPASCTVVHRTVLRGLQVVYNQRAVLCSVSTHISSDVKMLFERLLLLYVAVIHMSNAFQSSVSSGFLVPLHDCEVAPFMAADQLDFVSRSSEKFWRSLVDFITQTNS